MERTIKYKPGSARKRELDACVLALITTDLQPLSVVENKAFRRLMKKIYYLNDYKKCPLISRVLEINSIKLKVYCF